LLAKTELELGLIFKTGTRIEMGTKYFLKPKMKSGVDMLLLFSIAAG
jgi:hypothetical protein